GGVASTLWTRSKTQGGGLTAPDKEGPGPPEGVRVGDIVVKLGACTERGVRNEVQKTGEGLKPSEGELPNDTAQEKERRILLRNY
ncbi:hypothetical protein A2U01_0086582, partial [Trifolium medium]|nr:hypothetical protein [Trifolium medium]